MPVSYTHLDVYKRQAVGGAAAAAAFAGETGRMIALKRISAYPYQCITESVDCLLYTSRFSAKGIGTVKAKLPVFQRIGHGLLVHQCTAGGVQQDHAGDVYKRQG